MGDVIVVFKIMPSDMEKFDSLKANLEELKPHRLEEEPVAFGLKALKFTTIVPDDEGGADKIEEAIKSLDGVESVEVVEISRSL